MTASDHKIELATKLLEAIESGHSNYEQIVLRASRLADLVKNEWMSRLLYYERTGYPPDDPIAMQLLEVTNRKIPDTEKTKSMYHPQSAAELENLIAGYSTQIEATKAFVPSGDWAAVHLEQQRAKILELTGYRGNKIKVISTVKGLIYDFARDVYNTHVFSSEAHSIFEGFKVRAEKKLDDHIEIFQKWPSVFERLTKGDSEAISHAMTSCRRIIDGLAKSVLPGINGIYQIGNETIDCSMHLTRNRIRAHIATSCSSKSRAERLRKNLGSIYDRVSTGVHDDVSSAEAEALVLATYLFVGEILSLED